jgi:hypothetical protein
VDRGEPSRPRSRDASRSRRTFTVASRAAPRFQGARSAASPATAASWQGDDEFRWEAGGWLRNDNNNWLTTRPPLALSPSSASRLLAGRFAAARRAYAHSARRATRGRRRPSLPSLAQRRLCMQQGNAMA